MEPAGICERCKVHQQSTMYGDYDNGFYCYKAECLQELRDKRKPKVTIVEVEVAMVVG